MIRNRKTRFILNLHYTKTTEGITIKLIQSFFLGFRHSLRNDFENFARVCDPDRIKHVFKSCLTLVSPKLLNGYNRIRYVASFYTADVLIKKVSRNSAGLNPDTWNTYFAKFYSIYSQPYDVLGCFQRYSFQLPRDTPARFESRLIFAIEMNVGAKRMKEYEAAGRAGVGLARIFHCNSRYLLENGKIKVISN